MDGDGDDEQVPANDNVEMEPLPVLDLMIEVGVGKLRRDYASWLIGSPWRRYGFSFYTHAPTFRSLSFSLQGNNLLTAAQFDEIFDAHLPPADQIRRLHYLHRLIEVWSLIRQNVLCLPFENLRSCIQEAFSFWRDVVVREDDENHAISVCGRCVTKDCANVRVETFT